MGLLHDQVTVSPIRAADPIRHIVRIGNFRMRRGYQRDPLIIDGRNSFSGARGRGGRRECMYRSNPLWLDAVVQHPDSHTVAHYVHRESSGSRNPSAGTSMAQPATRSRRTGAGEPGALFLGQDGLRRGRPGLSTGGSSADMVDVPATIQGSNRSVVERTSHPALACDRSWVKQLRRVHSGSLRLPTEPPRAGIR